MSNLLEKASILTTPTAYNDGKLLSVKPVQTEESYNVDSTDFTVDGTSGNVYYKDTLSLAGTSGVATITFNHTVLQGTRSRVYIRNGADSGYITTYTTGDFSQGQSLPNLTKQGDISVIVTFTDGLTFGFLAENGNEIQIQNFKAVKIIDGDFDFTRNSSATRVASNGLIEDVQILSGNLVTNGDFSQEGAELVTNGDFATDSDWTVVGLATISNGVASFVDNGTNSNTYISQNVFTVGKFYKVTFDVTRYVSGRIQLQVNDIYSVDISGGVGTYTTYVKSNNVRLLIKRNGGYSNFDFDIDNVSVKEVGQDWTLGSGWSIGENKAEATNAPFGSQLVDSTTLIASKKYRVSFVISDYVQGNVRVGVGNSFSSDVSSNGNYTFILTASNTNAFKAQTRSGGGTTLSISNISVIEITDDTNLPRIGYTDGVGHILLEPQSTNTIINSNSDFLAYNMDLIYNNVKSPDGTQNAFKATTTTAGGAQFRPNQTITTPSTFSIFLKYGNNQWYQIINSSANGFYANIDVENGVFGTSGVNTDNLSVKDYGNGWYRFSGTFTSASTNGSIRVYASSSSSAGWAGVSAPIGSYVYGYGIQVEEQSYATSYIPTSGSGSTVTRLGETLNNSGSSDLINSTEGVLYAEVAALNDSLDFYIGIYGNSNSRIRLIFSPNQIKGQVFNGSYQARLSSSQTISNNNKVAFKYKQDDFALWINGVEVDTDNSGLTFNANTITYLNLASYTGASNIVQGRVKCVAVFEEALTDEELTCLTTI